MKKNFFTKAALLIAGYGMWSDNIVIPMATTIFAGFPDASLFMQNFILSGPSIISIPFAFLTALFARKVSKRKLLIFGTIMFTVSGVCGALCKSIEALAVCRAFDGASDGILCVTCVSLISQLYEEEGERAKMLGLYMGVSAMFGFVFSFFAGIIAQYDWHMAFLMNAVTLIAVILSVTSVPETPLEQKRERKKGRSSYPVWKVAFSVAAFFIVDLLYCVIFLCVDLYVTDRAIGDSVLSGTLSSLGTIVSCIASVFFGAIYKKIKHMTPLVCFFGCASGFFILGLDSSVFMVGAACIIAAGAWSISVPYYEAYVAEIVPKEEVSGPMAWITNANSLAVFAAPYIPVLLMRLIKGATYHTSMLWIAGLLVFFGLFAAWFIAHEKKAAQ